MYKLILYNELDSSIEAYYVLIRPENYFILYCACLLRYVLKAAVSLTIFRVLQFANAAVRGGSLIVIFRKGQGPHARPRR